MRPWLVLLLGRLPGARGSGSVLKSSGGVAAWDGGGELLASRSARSIGDCTNFSHCLVPPGEHWVVDRSISLETLTVQGTLVWDTTEDGLELRTGYLLVELGGLFQIGREAAPMEKNAVIYIVKGPHEHHKLGYRFVGAHGRGSRITLHGRRLARTWTLLSRTAKPGSKQLFLKHNAEVMGWRVGDRIGLATTSRGTSTQHTIESIGPATEWQLPILSVSAGKEAADQPPSKAIDESTSTFWWTWWTQRSSASKHWIQFDLGEPCYLTRLRVNWHPNRYAPVYTVQLLKDSSGDWATAWSFNVTSGQGGWQQVNISQNASAVRLFVPDWDALKLRYPQAEPAWAGLWLREVEVFGRPESQPAPTVLHLKEPVTQEHWGGFKEIQGHRFEMAAEVVNLERSVLITGDHADFYTTKQGLHTVMHGEGIMDIRYTRIEYCGQRDAMGRYCLHLHLAGQCPECTLQGNAVVDSQQVGITIHGTHRTMIDSNVLWDARGAGIYIEDGNEMNNIISNNAVICSWYKTCSVPWLLNAAFAGIYMVGMTNDLIGNHVAGYENGIWTPGDALPNGQGVAAGRVCPKFTPFGTIRGNVNHDCNRFGMYTDNQYPRRVLRNINGYITGGCGEFTETGEDNGVVPANVIEDEFDWHNMFVGQYSGGDISYVRYTSVNNAHSMYWKKSKNFADGVSHHIKDSIIANHRSLGYGSLQIFGPAGPFTFLLSNITFLGGPVGCGAVCAGQHCGRAGAGGPCDVQYLLEKVNFTGLDPGTKHIKFGINSLAPGYVTPLFLAPPNDMSLGGYQSIVSQHLTGFSNVSACEKTHWTYDKGYGCKTAVRRLNLWSTNLSIVHIQGEGYAQQPDWKYPVLGMNAGMMPFQKPNGARHGGYGMPVILGNNYTILGEWRGDVIVEFSDKSLTKYFGSEAVNVSFEANSNRPCELRAEDDEPFVGADGPAQGMPAIVRCVINKPQETTSRPPGGDLGGGTCTGRTTGSCSFASPPQITYYWEPCCTHNALGCHADAVNVECRFCGAGPWSTIPCPSTTTTTTLEGAFRFQLIKSGTCASLGLDPIQSTSICQDAAKELGLPDVSATSIQRPDRPEGCYWYSNTRLWINTDPRAAGNGAQANSSDVHRYPICEVPHYRIISDGTCASSSLFPITTTKRCEDAAKALGLSDTVASIDETHPDRPEGCYLFLGQYIWMGLHPGTVGKGAEQSVAGKSRHPICSTHETATATTTASPSAL